MNVDTIYVNWLVYKMEINSNSVIKMQIQTGLSNHWAIHASVFVCLYLAQVSMKTGISKKFKYYLYDIIYVCEVRISILCYRMWKLNDWLID